MEQNNNIQKAHFLNLFHIALSDNEIDPLELKELYRIGDENGVPKDEIDFIIENPHKVKTTEIDNDLQLFHNFLDISRILLKMRAIKRSFDASFSRSSSSSSVIVSSFAFSVSSLGYQ